MLITTRSCVISITPRRYTVRLALLCFHLHFAVNILKWTTQFCYVVVLYCIELCPFCVAALTNTLSYMSSLPDFMKAVSGYGLCVRYVSTGPLSW